MDRMKMLVSILVFLALALLFMFFFQNLSAGNFVSAIKGKNFDYSYTKAICDGNNLCQDYEINCSGSKIMKATPTGFAVKFPKTWTDPRSVEDINRTC